MAALHPSLVRVLQTMKCVFDRPRYGFKTYDFNPDDGMYLRGSGSFKFTADVKRPRSGHVQIVGSPANYRVQVHADFLDGAPKKSFGSTFMRQHKRMERGQLRSPKIRKFAAYAVCVVRHHFLQLVVDEVHDL